MVHLKLEQWEPGEPRGSRRVLRAARGAVPLADSPGESQVQYILECECFVSSTIRLVLLRAASV